MTTRLTTLPNGVRIVTDTMPHLMSAAITIDIGRASRDEEPQEHGLAHFLEHMAFKGTQRRSARRIAEEIENVGGELNAATSLEATSYMARVLKENVPLAMDMLTDILSHPVFPEEECQREKGVILQEIAAQDDSPDTVAFDHFMAAAYHGDPVGRSVLGSPKSLEGLTRERLVAFRERHYVGPETIVAAAGAVDHDSIVEQTELLLGHWPSTPAPQRQKAHYTGGLRHDHRELEQCHLFLGYEGLPMGHPDALALELYAMIVGGGIASRLFQEIREQRGLAYTVYAGNIPMLDTSLLHVYCGTSPERRDEVLLQAHAILMETAKDPMDEEIERAKTQVRAGLVMGLESPSARAEQLARQVAVHGKALTMQEMLDKLAAVSKDDMTRVATAALATPATVTTLGPKLRQRRAFH